MGFIYPTNPAGQQLATFMSAGAFGAGGCNYLRGLRGLRDRDKKRTVDEKISCHICIWHQCEKITVWLQSLKPHLQHYKVLLVSLYSTIIKCPCTLPFTIIDFAEPNWCNWLQNQSKVRKPMKNHDYTNLKSQNIKFRARLISSWSAAKSRQPGRIGCV